MQGQSGRANSDPFYGHRRANPRSDSTQTIPGDIPHSRPLTIPWDWHIDIRRVVTPLIDPSVAELLHSRQSGSWGVTAESTSKYHAVAMTG